MIRLGILDFDTSHVVEFTKRLNGIDIAADQRVDGARIVVGCPGESKISPERIPGYVEQMKKYGVPLVEKPADLIGKCDGIIVSSVDGSVHRDRVTPFLNAGLPCFVDKPFSCSAADARAMFDLADRKKVPLFSSSSLRYAPDVTTYLADTKRGALQGVTAFGPCSLHPRNPGLYHYGIHPVEMTYALMGPGCETVTCTHQPDVDVVTGVWKGGRVATIRGTRTGPGRYGFTAFAEKSTQAVNVGTGQIYTELLKRIVTFFETRKAPVAPAETIEIMAFIEAANTSGSNHGSVQTIGR